MATELNPGDFIGLTTDIDGEPSLYTILLFLEESETLLKFQERTSGKWHTIQKSLFPFNQVDTHGTTITSRYEKI